MAEFGKSILYMTLRGDLGDRRRAKIEMEPRYVDGIFLGLTDRSDEILVYGAEGIRKARSIRRRAEGERWRPEELLAVRGTPLNPNPDANDSRVRTRMEPGVANDQIVGDPVTKEDVSAELGTSRHPFHLMRKDVREAAKVIGFTRNCKGCKAVELGYTSRPMHSDECRPRMEEQIRKTTRGAARMEEFERRLASDVEARVRRIEVDEEINKPTKAQASGSGVI